MADQGRPTFDLSSLLAFAFPSAKSEPLAKVSGNDCASLHARESVLIPEVPSARTSDDEDMVDLAKYGPPDALTKLNQTVPATIITIIEDSIIAARAQIEGEQELRDRCSEQEEYNRVRDEAERDVEGRRAEDCSCLHEGKGKQMEALRHIRRSPASTSRTASDQTGSRLFYTPSDGLTPSAGTDTESEAETETLTAVPTMMDNGPGTIPAPGPRSTSTSATPRRRDLIKSMFRKTSDSDARRHALRRSTGALQLKAKLKHAKQMLQKTVKNRCVCLIVSLHFFV